MDGISGSRYTLAQVATRELEHDAMVLFDTSAVSTQLPSLTRSYQRYRDIYPAAIARGQWEFLQYVAFASAGNVRTVAGVIAELEYGHALLQQRKRVWDCREHEARGHSHRVYFPPQRNDFVRLLDTEEQLIAASRSSVLHPVDADAEENVRQLVTTVQQCLHVKREKLELRLRYAHFQTDEELVARSEF